MGVHLTITEESEMDTDEINLKEPPRRISYLIWKDNFRLLEQLGEESISDLSRMFGKSLLVELSSEDAWMETLRIVVERGDNQGFELMGPYTNPLWNQLAVIVNFMLVDKRLAVSMQLHPAVMKRTLKGNPDQEVLLGVSQYLWSPTCTNTQ